jgi:hypothetical protein
MVRWMATQIVEEQQPKVDLAVGSSRIVEASVIAAAADGTAVVAADEYTDDADRGPHPIRSLLSISHHTARPTPGQKPVSSPRSSQQQQH